MNFICYHDWKVLPNNSGLLFETAEKDSVFCSRQWFENLTDHITNQKQQLLLACVTEDNSTDTKVLTILPLLTNENKEWTSFCHTYSSLYSILLSSDLNKPKQQQVLKCLSLGLKQLSFEYLSLAPIAKNDFKIQALQDAMTDNGFLVTPQFHSYNWFHQTNKQSYLEYMAERPSNVSNTIKRKQRKLKREHQIEIQLHRKDDLSQAIKDYHTLYENSWKANEQYITLVEDFVFEVTKSGWPRLAILSIDGKPVAAHLWFVVKGKASIFRLVYDENWKQFSPGSVLMSHLISHVMDIDKVTEIDFLNGNDSYKKDWMTERRERSMLVFTKAKPIGTRKRKKAWFSAIKLY